MIKHIGKRSRDSAASWRCRYPLSSQAADGSRQPPASVCRTPPAEVAISYLNSSNPEEQCHIRQGSLEARSVVKKLDRSSRPRFFACHSQIYRKVTSQILPSALDRVQNTRAREFIRVCLSPDPDERPSAMDLQNHPFLKDKNEDEVIQTKTFSWQFRRSWRLHCGIIDHPNLAEKEEAQQTLMCSCRRCCF